MISNDDAIQSTNNDASCFKAYAVSKGYWQDSYIQYFVSTIKNNQSQVPGEHKPPEMSRGYFARVHAIRGLIDKFLDKYLTGESTSKCQIINLGAGYDTLFFNLQDKNRLPTKYVEIDFNRIVSSKIRIIKSKKALSDKLSMSTQANLQSDISKIEKPTIKTGAELFIMPASPPLFSLPTSSASSSITSTSNTELHTQVYHLISADLRNLIDLDKKLNECNLDFEVPTLIVTECVLVYMNPEHSNKLLEHFGKSFKKSVFVNYEQANLEDRFGQIMLLNMQSRACKLMGFEMCNSLDTQMKRFLNNGFTKSHAITMTDYYLNKLNADERKRIESLEFLDENELLIQLLDHYCVCIASNNECVDFIKF